MTDRLLDALANEGHPELKKRILESQLRVDAAQEVGEQRALEKVLIILNKVLKEFDRDVTIQDKKFLVGCITKALQILERSKKEYTTILDDGFDRLGGSGVDLDEKLIKHGEVSLQIRDLRNYLETYSKE